MCHYMYEWTLYRVPSSHIWSVLYFNYGFLLVLILRLINNRRECCLHLSKDVPSLVSPTSHLIKRAQGIVKYLIRLNQSHQSISGLIIMLTTSFYLYTPFRLCGMRLTVFYRQSLLVWLVH